MSAKMKANATKDSKKQRAYNSQPEQKKNRAARNKARRKAIAEGRASKGDGKDVEHKKPLAKGGSRSTSNTKVGNRSSNRSKGGKIGGKRSSGGGRPKGSKNK